ncbi:hypothetical protein BRADI_3g23195v3 [Brachypodium distachyon]|uniref:Uncharacterized protein n=1 Tax=Brachypodium distachyon TaxID=15368 RepID=A0A0Q3F9G4_BRADI|nr:hypothetical protein BRADI_3g23195v3 [Brachypodium distachyon]
MARSGGRWAKLGWGLVGVGLGREKVLAPAAAQSLALPSTLRLPPPGAPLTTPPSSLICRRPRGWQGSYTEQILQAPAKKVQRAGRGEGRLTAPESCRAVGAGGSGSGALPLAQRMTTQPQSWLASTTGAILGAHQCCFLSLKLQLIENVCQVYFFSLPPHRRVQYGSRDSPACSSILKSLIRILSKILNRRFEK